jgi:TolA-binding protein
MKIRCPASACRAENDTSNVHCIQCGIALREYVRLYLYVSHLFNAGLHKAQSGQLWQARDLFAAVVYWCPEDKDARNALATACFSLGDKKEARDQWQEVLQRFPADSFAMQGLERLARMEKRAEKIARTRLSRVSQ